MNRSIRLEGADVMSIVRDGSLAGRAVIDAIGQRAWGPIRVDRETARGHDGLRAALRVAGTLHRMVYTRTGGRIGGRLRGGPVLLLTTTGRKSGMERTRPVSYLHHGDDLVLVASAAGSPQHPDWYLNLRANPCVSIQEGDTTRTMVARIADGVERAQLWDRVVRQYPVVDGYQRRTERQIPVVILRPARASNPQHATDRRPRGIASFPAPVVVNAAA